MVRDVESWASSRSIRRTMQSNRSRDARPELAVRRLLHTRGLRYRVDYPLDLGIRRRSDIAFTGLRIAVFIDGCFWHGCSIHYQEPQTNVSFWRTKIERNIERDIETNAALMDAGWDVLRYWEHEAPALVAEDVFEFVQKKKAAGH